MRCAAGARLEGQLQQVPPRQLRQRGVLAEARMRAADHIDDRAVLPRMLHHAQLVRQQRHARVPRGGLIRQRACASPARSHSSKYFEVSLYHCTVW